MRGMRIAGVAMALGLCALSRAVCQTPDETRGQPLTIQTNVGSGYNCGRASSPLYCYGIPVNVGPANGGNGSIWLDTYVSGYNTGTGFIAFSGVEDLGQGTVTSNIPTKNSAGQVTKLVVNFHGSTNDGDNGTYTGTMTLTFSYYYSSGGGGRGGAGAGWRFICTGGSIGITYQ
jgi:hypothetical protein